MKKNNPKTYFKRNIKRFDEEFSIKPHIVINNMNNSGDDIPYQKPTYQLDGCNVSVDYDNIPITINNPLEGDKLSQLNCKIKLTTGLPSINRGIHISRIGNIVAEVSNGSYRDLKECANKLAKELFAVQYRGYTAAEIIAPLSFIEDVPGWKKGKDKKSLETVFINSKLEIINSEENKYREGLEVFHITACPCVQQTYKHMLRSSNQPMHEDQPFLTHSQRCRTRIDISDINSSLPLKKLLETLDNTVVRTLNTLPREHELHLVYRAHKHPQFIEDVVKSVLVNIYKLLGKDFPNATIQVFSKSMESIHNFDVEATITHSFKKLNKYKI